MIFASQNNSIPIGGRLGNQAMRVMSLMGLAEKHKTTFAIPDWPYAKYFENEIPQANYVKINRIVKEPHFHYCENLLSGFDLDKDIIDLHGFFQSPKYWSEVLRFKKGYLSALSKKYDLSKNPIAVSVRRGDFVNHKCYFQLSGEYYENAVKDNFPDYKNRSIFFFSDDMNYCRETFRFDNMVFVEASDIEQLSVMSRCDDFVISQSTFSVVGAYLANRGKVIRPIRNFDGEYANKHLEKDYWPEHWIVYTEK